MSTILIGLRIIDGTGSKPIENGYVQIDDGTIQAVGSGVGIPSESSSVVLDLKGRTVIPGIINLHAHISHISAPPESPMPAHPEYTAAMRETAAVLYAMPWARAALDAGITTIRDPGCAISLLVLRDAINEGRIVGPRLFLSGPRLVPKIRAQWTNDPLRYEINGMAEATDAVRYLIRSRVDLVKFIADGATAEGAFRWDAMQLSDDEARAIVDISHRMGLKVSSHALSAGAVKAAVRAGVDTIEHGYGLDEECIQLMLENDTYFVPTMQLFELASQYMESTGRDDWPFIRNYQTARDMGLENVAKAVSAGVKIAFGTDSAQFFNPHDEVVTEMHMLKKVGFSSMQAIVAATKTSAEALGQQQNLGTLEQGKYADLIVVDGDPLEDVDSLRRPMLVMKAGQLVVDRR